MAGYSVGERVITPGDDLDRTIAEAASVGGVIVLGFDRLGAAALNRVPTHVPCAATVEAPPPGRTPRDSVSTRWPRACGSVPGVRGAGRPTSAARSGSTSPQ